MFDCIPSNESGDWKGVVVAYRSTFSRDCKTNATPFSFRCPVRFQLASSSQGSSNFYPAACNARTAALSEFSNHVPLVVFYERRTGERYHTSQAVRQFQALNNEVKLKV